MVLHSVLTVKVYSASINMILAHCFWNKCFRCGWKINAQGSA